MMYLYLTGTLIIFLFLSCHKSNNGHNPSPYFLKLTIDCVARDFSGDFYFQNVGAVVAGPDKKTLQGQFYLPLQFTD